MTVQKPKNSQFYTVQFSVRGKRFHRSTGKTTKEDALLRGAEMKKSAKLQFADVVRARRERAFFAEDEEQDERPLTEDHVLAMIMWIMSDTSGNPYTNLSPTATAVIFRNFIVLVLAAFPSAIPKEYQSLRKLAELLNCSVELLSRVNLRLADSGFIGRAGRGVRTDQSRNRAGTIQERIKKHKKQFNKAGPVQQWEHGRSK